MHDLKSVIVLSAVAIVLVVVIVLGLAFNPWLAVGLPAALLAIAAIIRAIAACARTAPHTSTNECDQCTRDHDVRARLTGL